jgi:AcrR family transcriptional regulator
MRPLARELHVEAMALYRHAANKEDLLRGVLELVQSEIELPDVDSVDWKTWLRTVAIRTREAYLRHPNVLPIAFKYAHLSEQAHIRSDRIIQAIVRAGFSGEEVHHLHHQLMNTLWGALIFARFVPYQTSDRDQALEYFSEYVEYFAHCNNTTEFEFGLTLLLDAFEARLHAAQPSRAPRRSPATSTAARSKRVARR